MARARRVLLSELYYLLSPKYCFLPFGNGIPFSIISFLAKDIRADNNPYETLLLVLAYEFPKRLVTYNKTAMVTPILAQIS